MDQKELKNKAMKSLNELKNRGVDYSTKTKEFSTLYKFELSLIACVLAGAVMEGLLYAKGQSFIWGLLWLFPIYGFYKQEKAQTNTN